MIQNYFLQPLMLHPMGDVAILADDSDDHSEDGEKEATGKWWQMIWDVTPHPTVHSVVPESGNSWAEKETWSSVTLTIP